MTEGDDAAEGTGKYIAWDASRVPTSEVETNMYEELRMSLVWLPQFANGTSIRLTSSVMLKIEWRPYPP